MKRIFISFLLVLMLITPVNAQAKSEIKLLQLSSSLHPAPEVIDMLYDSYCLNIVQDKKNINDKATITSAMNCKVLDIRPLKRDPSNMELVLQYTLDNNEIILKIRQNYITDLVVGQEVKAGEVVAVYDKHVDIGADIICISAFMNEKANETLDYIKTED